MESPEIGSSSKWWWAIIGSLRGAVGLQCLGNWRWLTQIEETPLLHWLINPADLGGLGWSEASALATQQVVGWLALAAGACVVCRPCAAVLVPLTVLQVTMATAMWRVAEGFPLSADWVPPELITLFPLMTQSVRIVAPLGLLLLDPWRTPGPPVETRIRSAVTLMRWAVALTFFAHGVESWQHYPRFTDLAIASAGRLFGGELPQARAELMLSVVGVVDLLSAAACLATRSRFVLVWMAFWGMITACSRTVVDFDYGWHMTLTRIPHAAVPLAVACYWHLLLLRVRCRRVIGQA